MYHIVMIEPDFQKGQEIVQCSMHARAARMCAHHFQLTFKSRVAISRGFLMCTVQSVKINRVALRFAGRRFPGSVADFAVGLSGQALQCLTDQGRTKAFLRTSQWSRLSQTVVAALACKPER